MIFSRFGPVSLEQNPVSASVSFEKNCLLTVMQWEWENPWDVQTVYRIVVKEVVALQFLDML